MEDEINEDDNDCDNYIDDYDENEINDENENDESKQKSNNNKLEDFEIIPNSEIIKKRDVVINNFIECSNLNYDDGELVLVNYNWNYDKLIEEWFDNMEKIKISSHIEQSEESKKKIEEFISNNNISEDTCPVCYTEIEKNNSLSLKCNHQICKECYVEYIKNKILENPITLLQTSCPMSGCNLYITRTIFKQCITELKYKIIFAKSLIRNFLVTNKEIKTCPNPKCNLSIRVQNSIPKEIKCKCGQIFCFSCLEESHIPCDCFLAQEWKNFGTKFGSEDYVWIRKAGEKEQFTWINSFVKKCPNCSLIIEKTQGCNHMRCISCGSEFCWNCLKPWKNHKYCHGNNPQKKINTLMFPKQIVKKKNTYIPGGSNKNKENKDKLTPYERYMKYYKKWYNHFKNLEISDKIKKRLSELKNDLIENKNLLESDLNFLDESMKIIIDNSRVLKYIIIFEYFLKEDNEELEELIDNDLEILQNQVDSLLELIELDLSNIIKINDKDIFKKQFLEYKDHILTLINSTEKFKNNLVNEIENNLCQNIDYDAIKKLKQNYSIYKKSGYDKVKIIKQKRF